MTVRQALAQCGLAPTDARALLAHALGRDRAWLLAHATDELPQQGFDVFFAAARRRRDGEPVAYLTGRREFHDIELDVTPDVLIPRPETETLVDAALAHLADDAPRRVLDLGTGSGAIALAIARARPHADVLGVDRSDAAIAVARGNAERLAIGNARFARSDWFGALGDLRVDVIVANPPYIAAGDPHLVEGDLRFEPRAALTPGGDGLDALRAIIGSSPAHLNPGGVLLVEHGHDQSEAVHALFVAAGARDVRRHRDLAGHWRV
ncbi:MAG TPA: peptide chain release factor N(5)-glutamine methyltransferase, partial [Casimicrobiaceae bacterium]|nr:peptide chain release factor N(5)-glutamine methyltransferase [Casimicrobiaceae bacterium]